MNAPPDPRPVLDAALARVDDACNAIAEALSPSAAHRREILLRRARALSTLPVEAPAPAELVTLVVFERSGSRWAIEGRFVREVTQRARPEPIPSAPAVFAGIVEVRGELIPVVALDVVLGRRAPDAAPTSNGPMLVLGAERAELVLPVDRVVEIAHVPREALVPVPRDLRLPHIDASAGEVLVIDASSLLDDPSLRGEDGIEGGRP